MSTLNARARKHIAKTNFVFPKDKRYPIHDISHARNALARSSGKSEESQVKEAVYKSYPSLKPEVKGAENKATKLVERGFFGGTIKLSSVIGSQFGISPDVQVLRVGKFNHPKYGEFEITTATLQELKKNFDAKVRGVDLAIDYFHKSDEEAAAWFTELYLNEENTELWGKADWTAAATAKLSDREIRYFSPDFAFQWQDPETGVTYNNVLFGGGLTNRPFVKDMMAIVASEEREINMTPEQLKELQATILRLSEEGAEMKKKLEEMEEPAPEAAEDPECESDDPKILKKMLGEMKAKLAEYAESNKKLLAEKAVAVEAKKMAEKESAFNLLLTEGKACAAQKDAFIKGDMVEFVKLSQPLNLVSKGTGGGSGTTNGGGDLEDRILKLAEDKCKADKNLAMHDAISLAKKEIK